MEGEEREAEHVELTETVNRECNQGKAMEERRQKRVPDVTGVVIYYVIVSFG